MRLLSDGLVAFKMLIINSCLWIKCFVCFVSTLWLISKTQASETRVLSSRDQKMLDLRDSQRGSCTLPYTRYSGNALSCGRDMPTCGF